jgi:hypothetical protein
MLVPHRALPVVVRRLDIGIERRPGDTDRLADFVNRMLLLPVEVDAHWSRPDENGSDNPSIDAQRGIESMKPIDAFSALLGKET